MAAIMRCHIALLLANLTVIVMQPRRLRMRHVTFPYFVVNAPVLICEAMIGLNTAWCAESQLVCAEAVPANDKASAATAAIL